MTCENCSDEDIVRWAYVKVVKLFFDLERGIENEKHRLKIVDRAVATLLSASPQELETLLDIEYESDLAERVYQCLKDNEKTRVRQ
jgi:hypothetical protein